MKLLNTIFLSLLVVMTASAKEYHVSVNGSNNNPGTKDAPFRTISAASAVARAGDVITVHEGTYREWIKPSRGGEADNQRIVYRAAEGEQVHIKGSEVATGWKKVEGNVWKLVVPESLFGEYNPYRDVIWGDWYTGKGRKHHTGEVYINGKSLYEVDSLAKVINPQPLASALDVEGSKWAWYCESNEKETTIWANFHGKNPNKELVEINVRPACFYPVVPGINYITISGFRMSQAATQWAPPTAEQIGLIGTHWSKGWIIENNVISDSKCTGITLGKERATGHNVWSLDPTKDGSVHYIEVIFRAREIGWDKSTVGSHIIRNNTIFNCEQTGICGSLGGVFSTITGNHIYNIWTKRQFDGPEIAGIKIHGAVDMLIENNRIHDATMGLFMDWMAQGLRVSRNLLYNNDLTDIYMEVNHGPFVIDNNLLLSHLAIMSMSQGGAYVHNFVAGKVKSVPDSRFVPYFFPHSTHVLAFSRIYGGDDRWYNNIFAGHQTDQSEATKHRPVFQSGFYGLTSYDAGGLLAVYLGSNYHCGASRMSKKEKESGADSTLNVNYALTEQGDDVYIEFDYYDKFNTIKTPFITTEMLGKARLPMADFENREGTPLKIDYDYFAKPRNVEKLRVGPFEQISTGRNKIKVW